MESDVENENATLHNHTKVFGQPVGCQSTSSSVKFQSASLEYAEVVQQDYIQPDIPGQSGLTLQSKRICTQNLSSKESRKSNRHTAAALYVTISSDSNSEDISIIYDDTASEFYKVCGVGYACLCLFITSFFFFFSMLICHSLRNSFKYTS